MHEYATPERRFLQQSKLQKYASTAVAPENSYNAQEQHVYGTF